jgi:hypothetical protein
MVTRWYRGKHRRDEKGFRRFATALLGVVAVAGLATLVATLSGGRAGPAAVPTGATSVPATVQQAAAAVQACGTTVARAHDAVAAAQPSYSHWAGHVRAQLDYDAGTATLEQTRARWAETKATADADLAGFATAYGAYQAVQDGCGDQEPGDDPVMAGCRSEFASASSAVTAAKAVVDDWGAHVAMMKGKEHTDPTQYGRMWRDMVRAAPPNLDRFAQASLDLSDHTGCPRPA